MPVGGWNGAQSIYDSNLREVEDYKALVAAKPLTMPAMAIDQEGSGFTGQSFAAASGNQLKMYTIPNTGHYVAMEAPAALAAAILDFVGGVDRSN
tara:strand:+ start:11617 stop:11901 length:285 start_codon:yes stop_codon:yes gene_type:complete